MGDEKTERLRCTGSTRPAGFLQAKIAEGLQLRYMPILQFQLLQQRREAEHRSLALAARRCSPPLPAEAALDLRRRTFPTEDDVSRELLFEEDGARHASPALPITKSPHQRHKDNEDGRQTDAGQQPAAPSKKAIVGSTTKPSGIRDAAVAIALEDALCGSGGGGVHAASGRLRRSQRAACQLDHGIGRRLDGLVSADWRPHCVRNVLQDRFEKHFEFAFEELPRRKTLELAPCSSSTRSAT